MPASGGVKLHQTIAVIIQSPTKWKKTMTTFMLHEIMARQNRNLFGRLTSNLTLRLRQKMQRRQARKALLSLDDHMLRDIGVARRVVLSDEF